MASTKLSGPLRRKLDERIAKAERESGYRSGRYRWGDNFVSVRVTFYPDTKWHVGSEDDWQHLTPEIWAQLVPFEI